MFEELAVFRTILVTGPQRSGTRIAARMIAADTGHRFVDEREIFIDSLYQLAALCSSSERLVIQCPALSRYVHHFDSEDVAVVMMRRQSAAIVASQERIGWTWEALELMRYEIDRPTIAQVKYDYWDSVQKARLRHPIEQKYEGLRRHPFWVDAEKRRDFAADQTQSEASSASVAPATSPRWADYVICWEEEGLNGAFLLSPGRAMRINETGRLIWSLCDGRGTRQSIFVHLAMHYPDVDPHVLGDDLDRFLADLSRKGLLSLDPLGTGSPEGIAEEH